MARWIGLLGVVGLLGCSGARVASENPVPMDPWIEEAIGWLPVDTDTIEVVNYAFSFPRVPIYPWGDPELKHWIERIAVGHVLGFDGSMMSDEEPPPGPFFSREVRFALQAARDFSPPSALGSYLYSGVELVFFEEPIREIVEGLGHGRKEVVEGLDFYVRTTSWSDSSKDDRDVYLGLLDDRTVAVATERDFLRTVILRRSGREAEGRAIPEDHPAWRGLDRSSPVWGVRRIDLAEDPWEGSVPPRWATDEARAESKAEATFWLASDGVSEIKARWTLLDGEDALSEGFLALVDDFAEGFTTPSEFGSKWVGSGLRGSPPPTGCLFSLPLVAKQLPSQDGGVRVSELPRNPKGSPHASQPNCLFSLRLVAKQLPSQDGGVRVSELPRNPKGSPHASQPKGLVCHACSLPAVAEQLPGSGVL